MNARLDERPSFVPVATLMLYLTEECNLRCTYCFVDKKPRRMRPETARKAVDYLLDGNVSGGHPWLNINFFGGEPFLEPDLMEEVIAYASRPREGCDKQIEFSATTNGTIASPRVERLIRDNRMSLLISLDGGEQTGHYRPFVSGRSSYRLVARNLSRLTAWSPNAIVRMTFHPGALDLVANIEKLLELGARTIAMAPVLEADWRAHEQALEAAYDALADSYIGHARQGFIPPLALTNMLLQQYHAVRHKGAERPMRPCGVGTRLLGIDPDGNVMPCHRFLYRPHDWLGTVNDAPVPEKRQKYVHLLSRDMLGCSTCPAEPVCGGGCRFVAVNAGPNLHEPYAPFCITMRAHARAVHRIYERLVAEKNPYFIRSLYYPDTTLTGPIRELVAS